MARTMSTSSSRSSTVEALDSKEILRLEYEQLNQWARHGEEAAHRIFNFYVSLLTAMFGGFILITQLVKGSLQTILLIGGGICGLLIIIGVTFLDALMSQYNRNIHYRIGIERIRSHFRQDAGVAAILSKPPITTLEADAETFFFTLVEGRRFPIPKAMNSSWLVRVFTHFFPVSTQQIFLSMVTSLLVGTLILLLVWGLSGVINWSGKVVLTISLAIILSFLVQDIMVRTALQRPLDLLREILYTSAENPPQTNQRSVDGKKGR